jgi:hypothetical protein
MKSAGSRPKRVRNGAGAIGVAYAAGELGDNDLRELNAYLRHDQRG